MEIGYRTPMVVPVFGSENMVSLPSGRSWVKCWSGLQGKVGHEELQKILNLDNGGGLVV